ncbi:threonine--tRNA ligase, partial [bacterium]|nr:threonine--tRNA ligase [bacterium]
MVALGFTDEKGMEILRHSTAHLMAAAVKELYPETKVAIGPAIVEGFYYDFDRENPFTPEDLKAIEQRMLEIARKKEPFVRQEMSRDEARNKFEAMGESYKLELLNAIEDDQVSIYSLGGFHDLCRGPHVSHSGILKTFKLLSIAGAYWRGD